MIGKKFCHYCSTFVPVEDIVYEWRTKGSRRIKKVICKRCKTGRERTTTAKQRDAYGRKVTEDNSAKASARMRTFHKNNKEQTK